MFNTRRQDQGSPLRSGGAATGAFGRAASPKNISQSSTAESRNIAKTGISATMKRSTSEQNLHADQPTSGALHDLDNNMQKLLRLSSKISNDRAVARDTVAPSLDATRVTRIADDRSRSPQRSWVRPRSQSTFSSPSAGSNGLRSAEMVQQHQMMSLAAQDRSATPAMVQPMSSLMPSMSAHSLYQPQGNTKFDIDAEYLRSSFGSSKSPKSRPSLFSSYGRRK